MDEAETGQRIANLAFWELAAAARPMAHPEGWQIIKPPHSDRLERFIAEAGERAGS